VAVEQDEHRGGIAETADPLLDPLALDRVDHVDPAVDRERVRRARNRAGPIDPAETHLRLVAEVGQANVR
jgi:hypothetical protein